jgi:EAL domain-containing protein (putative c-di-GMP-specific phosphodiesterase class I)
MGCDLGQGFAVARPMAAREVAAMAAAQADAPACSPVV